VDLQYRPHQNKAQIRVRHAIRFLLNDLEHLKRVQDYLAEWKRHCYYSLASG
jgi:hypothetical protein